MSKSSLDISQLTPEERLRLIEELWDSLSASHEQIPLTPAQEAELDRRIAAMEQDDNQGVPLDEVIRRIRDRRK